jgi:hypothetical protein
MGYFRLKIFRVIINGASDHKSDRGMIMIGCDMFDGNDKVF